MILGDEVLRIRATQGHFVGFGLPFPQGSLVKVSTLELAQKGVPVTAYATVRSRWPDGSVRWIWCEVVANGDSPISISVSEPATNEAVVPSTFEICNFEGKEKPDEAASTGESIYFASMPSSLATNEIPVNLGASLKLVGDDGLRCLRNVRSRLQHWPHAVECRVNAEFPWGKRFLNFSCVIRTFRATGQTSISIRIHNPRAASHPGGCWDLGDKNSAYIETLSFHIATGNVDETICCVSDAIAGDVSIDEKPLRISGDWHLAQTGSGGANWDSPVHWDHAKKSTVTRNGFSIYHGEDLVHEGLRAKPVFILKGAEAGLAFRLNDFWQNFPVSVASQNGAIQFKLFPQLTELQGGESKTWKFEGQFVGFDDFEESLQQYQAASADVVTYNPAYINLCGVFPQLYLDSNDSPITSIIRRGIEGPDTFAKKREEADEYGWRNFGDLYADHERHGLPEQHYFVSHYNNQYDPLMGMTIQYLIDGNEAWLDLLHPLSRHIQDIDIYDTDEDKAEYNGGLFWHTNHYLSAETCTHRSYSKYHTAAYQDFSGGGGPGGQHCYTTGLAMQYLLFGDVQAKEKVIQLCHWIDRFYNGDGTVLDRLYRFLTIDLKENQVTNIGIKAPGYRYPLDRGAGNYLNALLDAFDVSDDAQYLEKVDFVIRNTAHPGDDIASRNLDDVENRWFYTVFLQAVGRFVLLKLSLSQRDDAWCYAGCLLLHYGGWMLEHDEFYLNSPEKLEFPNHTWVAQEMRKVAIFRVCAIIADQSKHDVFKKKADFYLQYVGRVLSGSSEAAYTRIIALLLQSQAMSGQLFDCRIAGVMLDNTLKPKSSNLKIYAFRVLLKELKQALRRISLRNEVLWVLKKL